MTDNAKLWSLFWIWLLFVINAWFKYVFLTSWREMSLIGWFRKKLNLMNVIPFSFDQIIYTEIKMLQERCTEAKIIIALAAVIRCINPSYISFAHKPVWESIKHSRAECITNSIQSCSHKIRRCGRIFLFSGRIISTNLMLQVHTKSFFSWSILFEENRDPGAYWPGQSSLTSFKFCNRFVIADISSYTHCQIIFYKPGIRWKNANVTCIVVTGATGICIKNRKGKTSSKHFIAFIKILWECGERIKTKQDK